MPLHVPFATQHRHHFMPKKLRYFTAGTFCVQAAMSFVFIAAPVYLFQTAAAWEFFQSLTFPVLGTKIAELSPTTAGLFGLSLFYLIQRIGSLLFAPLVVRTIQRLGFGPSLVLGSLLYMAKFAVFPLLEFNPWLFFLLPFLSAYGLMLYWISSHTFLSASLIIPMAGKEVGSLEFVTRLAQVMAPLLGALLTVRFGIVAPILASSIFFVLGSVLFLHLPAIKTSTNWQWSDYWQWAKKPSNRAMNLALSSHIWTGFGISIFWPVFLFITFQHLESVGYILATASFLSLLFVYLSGWIFDLKAPRSWLRLGTGTISSLLWIPRVLLISNPFAMVINDSLDRIVSGMYSTVFMTSMYLWARTEKVFAFMIHREITISISILVFLSVFCAFLIVGWPWELVFVTFALANFTSMVLAPPKETTPVPTP